MDRLVLEYCRDCRGHQWHTQHDEARYRDLRNTLAQMALAHNPRLHIEDKQKGRLGSFEVYFNSHKIYSKLLSKKFPQPDSLMEIIKRMSTPRRPRRWRVTVQGGELEDKYYNKNINLLVKCAVGSVVRSLPLEINLRASLQFNQSLDYQAHGQEQLVLFAYDVHNEERLLGRSAGCRLDAASPFQALLLDYNNSVMGSFTIATEMVQ